MTVKYLDSKRISALSSDVVNTPTFEDNFSTVKTGWASEDTSRSDVNTSTEKLDIDQPYSTSIHAYIAYDFGASSVNSTKWVLRLKWNASTFGSSSIQMISMTSGNQTVSSNTSQSHATFEISRQGGGRIGANASNSGTLHSGATYSSAYTTTTSTDYYVELIRNGDSFTSNFRTGSHSGTLVATATDTQSGVIGDLRYLKFSNIDWDTTVSAGNIVATVDDVEFYNGVSPLTNKPTNVQDNSILVEKDTGRRYWYDGSDWTWENSPTRGLSGGGRTETNVIEYITIATTGNATDFGDLTLARYGVAGYSSETRGCWSGGYGGGFSNIIDYVTIATTGNAIDFGDLTTATFRHCGVSNLTRGVVGGGNNTNVMDYVTIATTGNATDFGDLTTIKNSMAGNGITNTTRGIFSEGDSLANVTDYITIATTGNAIDFGDLTVIRSNSAGVSSETRGCWIGGNATGTSSNVIDYVTISTTGNAIDFGDLTVGTRTLAGCSSLVRGVSMGGYTSSNTNVMDYITISTTGNATDFGDLTAIRANAGNQA
tara:strand:- start:225 stop:1853 length:1629 start_codon:yes stop_codon:yes gene_type:complete